MTIQPPATIYADSSALVKLILDEPESAALAAHVAGARLVTSAIAMVEVTRAVKLANEAALDECGRLLASCARVRVSDEIIVRATALSSRRLRSLDALHLATALVTGLTLMAAYDDRLAEMASAAGFEIIRPI